MEEPLPAAQEMVWKGESPPSKWWSPPTETPHLCSFLNYCGTTTTILLGVCDSAMITNCLGILLSYKCCNFSYLKKVTLSEVEIATLFSPLIAPSRRISFPPTLASLCILCGPTPLPRSGGRTLADPHQRWVWVSHSPSLENLCQEQQCWMLLLCG